MMAGAEAGAPVVGLDEAVAPLGLSADERGRSLNWLGEGMATSGARVGPFSFAGGLRAETPLAPVHLRGRREAGGVHLSWVRRGRFEADDWEASEIPLDEPEERYRVDILDGVEVRRTAETGTPAFLYTAADEFTDFGAPQQSLAIRVRQVGRAVPLGLPSNAVISLDI